MASARERDEGLRRVSRVTRWVAAGAVGVAAAFSIAAAKAVPGRSSTRLPAGQAPVANTGSGTANSAGSSSADNGTTATTSPSAVDPNAGLTPLAPPPINLGSGGGGGSVVSGGS
ncbi:MAG TPA: hypothetical protein VKV34_11820 [Thermoleophilia bacterium]|nr:hypothetical protein [Thermoleophilia bacterium]